MILVRSFFGISLRTNVILSGLAYYSVIWVVFLTIEMERIQRFVLNGNSDDLYAAEYVQGNDGLYSNRFRLNEHFISLFQNCRSEQWLLQCSPFGIFCSWSAVFGWVLRFVVNIENVMNELIRRIAAERVPDNRLADHHGPNAGASNSLHSCRDA